MGANQNKVTGRINFVNHKTYKNFVKKYPQTTIRYEDFITILKTSNSFIRDSILNNPLGFKLPYELGYIAINKFKPGKKHVAIDWVNTLKYKKKIPLLNLHSFGYSYKINLYKHSTVAPIKVYNFSAHRILKRMLAARIKSGAEHYIEIDSTYYTKRHRIDKLTK